MARSSTVVDDKLDQRFLFVQLPFRGSGKLKEPSPRVCGSSRGQTPDCVKRRSCQICNTVRCCTSSPAAASPGRQSVAIPSLSSAASPAELTRQLRKSDAAFFDVALRSGSPKCQTPDLS